MDKESREYIESLLSVMSNLIGLAKKLIIGVVITLCIMAISMCVTVCYSHNSSNSAMTEWFRLYMETDYEIPELEIQQSIDQEIGVTH